MSWYNLRHSKHWGHSIVQILTQDEIVQIYTALVEEFQNAVDPITPAGIKSEHLLESAVARQDSGFGDFRKYPSVEATAASLMYGIIHNHPFHNGNKRTALVSTLVFLDKNGRVMDGVEHRDLYNMVLRVARHQIVEKRRFTSDDEIEAARLWIRRNCRVQERGERVITFRELRRLLGRYDYTLESPRHNRIEVWGPALPQGPWGLFGKPGRQRITTIGYPGDNSEVPKGDLKGLRKTLRLTEADGIDAKAFYDDKAIVDGFMARYQTILRRLAKQ